MNTIAAQKSYIISLEKKSFLYDEKNFESRNEIIDYLEFQVIEPLIQFMDNPGSPDKAGLLICRAEKLKAGLEETDKRLFQKIRERIQARGYTGQTFNQLVREYVALQPAGTDHPDEPGYDNLDIFINGLFPVHIPPQEIVTLEPEMVYYQKTPARIVFEIAGSYPFRSDDIFVDLGAGLGQVAILINLLTGITTTGVELEPAYCRYASECVRDLRLSNVHFMNIDARKADLSEGTVFFMYTPFHGKILQDVLTLLHQESSRRKITVITYGPCTIEVARQYWLSSVNAGIGAIYKYTVFTSRHP